MDIFTPLVKTGSSVPVTRDWWTETWPELAEVRSALSLAPLPVPHFPMHLLLNLIAQERYEDLMGVADHWTDDLFANAPSPLVIEIAKVFGEAADALAATKVPEFGDSVLQLLTRRICGMDTPARQEGATAALHQWQKACKDPVYTGLIQLSCLYYLHRVWLLTASEYAKAAGWTAGFPSTDVLGKLAPATVSLTASSSSLAKIRVTGLRAYV